MRLIKEYFATRKIVKENMDKTSQNHKAIAEANKVFSNRVRTEIGREISNHG